jgi:hypothetical protein
VAPPPLTATLSGLGKALNASRPHAGALVNRLVLAPKLAAANASCHNRTVVTPVPLPPPPPTFDDDMANVDVQW